MTFKVSIFEKELWLIHCLLNSYASRLSQGIPKEERVNLRRIVRQAKQCKQISDDDQKQLLAIIKENFKEKYKLMTNSPLKVRITNVTEEQSKVRSFSNPMKYY